MQRRRRRHRPPRRRHRRDRPGRAARRRPAGPGRRLVVITSRKPAAPAVVDAITARFGGSVSAVTMADAAAAAAALEGAELVLNAGPAGVCLIPQAAWAGRHGLKAIADVNAVPPLGVEGIDVTDDGAERDGVIVVRRTRRRQAEDEDPQGLHRPPVRAQRPGARRGDDLRARPRDHGRGGKPGSASGPGFPVFGSCPASSGSMPAPSASTSCGLDDGRVFLERSFPTRDAADESGAVAGLLDFRGAPRPRRRAIRLRPAADRGARSDRRRSQAGVPGGGRRTGRHRRIAGAGAGAGAAAVRSRAHPGGDSPAVGTAAPQGQSRRHGDRGQGVRGGAGRCASMRPSPGLRPAAGVVHR